MLATVCFFLTVALSSPPVNPAIEARAREIEAKIIVPCCWTQPVSQHYSEVAGEIRKQVREMLAAGKSEEQILDFYVAEYGERILASPRARGFNILVYVLPWVGLVAGFAMIALVMRKWLRRRAVSVPGEISNAAAPGAEYNAQIEKELREFEQ